MAHHRRHRYHPDLSLEPSDEAVEAGIRELRHELRHDIFIGDLGRHALERAIRKVWAAMVQEEVQDPSPVEDLTAKLND